uniref:Uncharacterized protein n=1 Tax=Panagrolaimus sp. ES5 TaxID=591445 RepID=A0AC34FS08_9BILA
MLNSVTLTSPSSNNGSHYETIDSKTEIIVNSVKVIDHPRKSKFPGQCCSFWCLIVSAFLIGLLIFALVFGWHEKLSFGNINGSGGANGTDYYYEDSINIPQGNFTMEFLTGNINPNKTTTLALTSPKTTTTTKITSTNLSTTTSPSTTTTRANRLNITINNLTKYPYGWQHPIKNVTALIQNLSTTSTTPTTTTTTVPSTTTTTTTTVSTTTTTTTQLPSTTTTPTFEQRDKNVFGNMTLFLSDKNRFVVSPFILNYILSFIGKFGDASTKAVIADKYFGVNDINQMYDYFSSIKDTFYYGRHENPWFLLNAFISGDNPPSRYRPQGKKFMEEVTEKDGVAVYPDSSNDYNNYYNERIKKNLYDNEKYVNFFSDQLKASTKKVVGFSHVQKSLRFKKT